MNLPSSPSSLLVRPQPWLVSTIVALAAAISAFVGIRYGTYAAADSDPYGYISQADAMAHGALRIDQRFAATMRWPFADMTLSPPGWRPSPDGFIVPTYSPGLPLVMAAFQRAFGRIGVFYVVPLLGALAVWMTGRLGTRIHSPAAGVYGALLLATSTIFLYEVVQPVSDVAATAWWVTSLACVVAGTSGAAFLGGAAASMAVLTRPNLVPIAAVIAGYLAACVLGGRFTVQTIQRSEPRFRIRDLVERASLPFWLFVVAVVPSCLAVGASNRFLFGSPLASGYGDLGELYSFANLWPNLARYPRWLVQTATPFIFLGALAPIVVLRRARPRPSSGGLDFLDACLLLTVSIVVLLSYLFYAPWGWDEWGYLRFLLPSYPCMLVLSVIVAIETIPRMIEPRRAGFAVLVLVGLVASWQTYGAIRRGAFVTRFGDARYVDTGRFVAKALPTNAVFISGAQSGSLRYYSGRLTLRYDLLAGEWLDRAVDRLRSRGYQPFVLLEEAEEMPFRQRFSARNALGSLDWPPIVRRSQPIRVHIYDPDDRARFMAGDGIVTGDIDLLKKPTMTIRSTDGTSVTWSQDARNRARSSTDVNK